jgi:hypothetical protein
MSDTLIGASVWEDDLYRHLSTHIASEIDLLTAYKSAADESKSAAFRYLANLIIESKRWWQYSFHDKGLASGRARLATVGLVRDSVC